MTASVVTRSSVPALARAYAAEAGIAVGVRGRLSAAVLAAFLSNTDPKTVRQVANEVGFVPGSKGGRLSARDIHALAGLLHGPRMVKAENDRPALRVA